MMSPSEFQPSDDTQQILQRVAQWAGGLENAIAWYRSELLPEFGGRTAEDLVVAGNFPAVQKYLDHVEAGGFA